MVFPYEIKPVDGAVGEMLKKRYEGYKNGMMFVGPKNYCLPTTYAKNAENYYNFELRKDDIWVMTYPRSGTTWMQELVWLIGNDLDFTTASKIPLFERVPFFEFDMIFEDEFLEKLININNDPTAPKKLLDIHVPGNKFGHTMKSPRLFKTHLPPSLMPPKLLDTCKVVYVARNPYDVVVSYYHHNQLFRAINFQGDLKEYCDLFESDLLVYSPYWDHLKEAWDLKDHPNLLFVFYEDLLRDMPGNLRKISKFLNKEITEEGIQKLDRHLHIDNFRKNVILRGECDLEGLINEKAQPFIRKGKVGKNEEITNEIRTRIDKWYEENISKTGIKFPKFN